VPLPAFVLAAVAVGKAIHSWANTSQGKAVIRTAQTAIAYHRHRQNPTPDSAQALMRSVGNFSQDVAAPAATHIAHDVRHQLHPPAIQHAPDGSVLWIKPR
jgi:hypothetical protein